MYCINNNATAINVSINFHTKKLRHKIDYHILHTLLSVIILLYFDIENIVIDEKRHENNLIYDISYKTLIGPKPLQIRFDKKDGFIRICMELFSITWS